MVVKFVSNLLLVISLVKLHSLLILMYSLCFLLLWLLLKVMLLFVVQLVLLTQLKLPYIWFPSLELKLNKLILISLLFTLELVMDLDKFLFHLQLIVLWEEVQIQ